MPVLRDIDFLGWLSHLLENLFEVFFIEEKFLVGHFDLRYRGLFGGVGLLYLFFEESLELRVGLPGLELLALDLARIVLALRLPDLRLLPVDLLVLSLLLGANLDLARVALLELLPLLELADFFLVVLLLLAELLLLEPLEEALLLLSLAELLRGGLHELADDRLLDLVLPLLDFSLVDLPPLLVLLKHAEEIVDGLVPLRVVGLNVRALLLLVLLLVK